MKKVTPLLTLAIATAISAASPYAAAASLFEIYQLAQQSDPTLRAAEAGYQAALQSKPQAKAPLLPKSTPAQVLSGMIRNSRTRPHHAARFSTTLISFAITTDCESTRPCTTKA